MESKYSVREWMNLLLKRGYACLAGRCGAEGFPTPPGRASAPLASPVIAASAGAGVFNRHISTCSKPHLALLLAAKRCGGMLQQPSAGRVRPPLQCKERCSVAKTT